jgi:protein TonB
MDPPKILVKTQPTYSKEAFAMKIGGVALAKCIIELDGSLSNCRLTKGLQYMDQQILEMLKSWRYSPVMYQGHPQRVEMVIPVRVATPG